MTAALRAARHRYYLDFLRAGLDHEDTAPVVEWREGKPVLLTVERALVRYEWEAERRLGR